MDASLAATDGTGGDECAERFPPGEEMLPGLLAWVMLGDGRRSQTWLGAVSATEALALLETILPDGEDGL